MVMDRCWQATLFATAVAAACGVDERTISTADAAGAGGMAAGEAGPGRADAGDGQVTEASADTSTGGAGDRGGPGADVSSDSATPDTTRPDAVADSERGDSLLPVEAGESSAAPDASGDTSPGGGAEADARRPSGSILWARSTSSLYLFGLAEGSTGVAVSGTISAPADLGGTLLVPVGATDTVLAQFASSDAAHQYSSRFGGGAGDVYGFLDVLDPNSTPLVFGLSYGNVDLGAGMVQGGGGTGADGFVGRYQPNGRPQWVKRLVGPGDDHFTSVANGPSNTIFVSGWYADGTAVFDGTRTFNSAGYRDILLMQLDYGGNVLMTKTFATAGFEQASSIAWTGTHLMVAGFYNPTTTIGSFSLSAVDYGIWAGKFLPDGTPVWVVGFSGPGKDHNPSMTIDAAGDMYVTGTFTGSIGFGSYNLVGAGAEVFVVKLRNSDGGVVWASSFGSAGDDGGDDIALNPSGELIVSATVAGALQPGGPFAGGTDVALVSYDTAGTRRWSKVIGTSGTDSAAAVSSGANAFYAALNLAGDIGSNVEGQPIIGAPKPAGLVLKLQP
jgi:hypothetical protein